MKKKIIIILSVFFVSLLAIFFLTRKEEKLILKSKKENLTLTEEEIRYQHFFAPNNTLEKLIAEKTVKGSDIRFYSPLSGDTINSVVNFRWSPSKNYKEFLITILNNSNKKIWQRKISSTNIRFTGTLSPGLYYWKVESKNQLLYAGKFFVKN